MSPEAPHAGSVVVGYDGTERGADALALGAHLADALDASLVVATAVADPNGLLSPAELASMSEEHAGESLRRAVEILAPREARTAIVSGYSAGHALNRLAEDERPLALVIGSSHHGRLGRVVLGSVGESLLSGAPCPVAVAPRCYAGLPERDLARIGVALDGSPEAGEALTAAARIASRPSAELTLIAVAPRSTPDIGGAMLSMLSREELEQSGEQRMEEVLDRAEAAIDPGYRIRRRLLHGDPAPTLARECQRLDLLVVGSRQYGPLRRTLLGSVSRQLSHSACTPLLVVPRIAAEVPTPERPATSAERAPVGLS